MTDYIYSMSLADQTKSFLLSFGLGFIMGAFYDLFRIIRISISNSKKLVLPFDLTYCIFLAFCSYLFLLVVNEGEIRAFLFLGEVIGFAIYYFSLGVVVFRTSEKIIVIIKRFVSFIFRIIFAPLRWISDKSKKFLEKFSKKCQKNTKNVKNKSKFHLKLYKHLLYNQSVKMAKDINFQEKEV